MHRRRDANAHDGLDAIIDGTGGDGSACAIDLKQGTAVATTAPNGAQNTGASIKAGDVTLGARGSSSAPYWTRARAPRISRRS